MTEQEVSLVIDIVDERIKEYFREIGPMVTSAQVNSSATGTYGLKSTSSTPEMKGVPTHGAKKFASGESVLVIRVGGQHSSPMIIGRSAYGAQG